MQVNDTKPGFQQTIRAPETFAAEFSKRFAHKHEDCSSSIQSRWTMAAENAGTQTAIYSAPLRRSLKDLLTCNGC